MISHLIHDSEESLSSERSMRLIYKDTAGSMNANAANVSNFHKLIAGLHLKNNGAAIDLSGNNGLHCSYLHTRQSQEVMLTGGLRVYLFGQSCYLDNGISMKLRLHRQKDE